MLVFAPMKYIGRAAETEAVVGESFAAMDMAAWRVSKSRSV
jgi:hypothetical protein